MEKNPTKKQGEISRTEAASSACLSDCLHFQRCWVLATQLVPAAWNRGMRRPARLMKSQVPFLVLDISDGTR